MAIERNNSFHLLLSDDELKLLKLLAEREGLNASDYLRMLIRTMPSSNSQLRLPGGAGRADLAKLFQSYAEVFFTQAEGPEGKRKKAK
jgi:hypothetical protein